ncbi:hypothetical protein [Ferruginibacter sp.]|nr:right-handed parallel beta-helix repeat-containing protein [Ferruginibacter sp.]
MIKYKLLVLFLVCNVQVLTAQKTKTYNLVTDFGAKPDDKTDCYPAFVKAAAALSKAGGGSLIIPKGKYYIGSYKIAGGPQKNTITDIIFKNCTGLTIEGNNSVVRVNGNFSRNSDYQAPGLPYNYAFNSSVCAFKLINCKNTVLKNIELNGEVDKMRKQPGVVEGESYGVFIADYEPGDVSSNIRLQNITAHHFASDGFQIQSNGEDIMITKCNLHHNGRQGLSIVKGSNIKCLFSSFDSTGHTGVYGWHPPGAGIDVENEFGPGKLKNVLIQNCTLRGNKGFQIVTTLASDKVIIDSCFISDMTAGYSDGVNGVGMYSMHSVLTNSILFATIQVDLADQIYKGEVVQQFTKNLIYSGHRGVVSADFARPADIMDNILIMLPNSQVDSYFPYIQNINCRFNRNIVVVHADRVKRTPNVVTALLQYVAEVSDDFWLVNNYGVPKNKRQKDCFYPAFTEAKKMKHHFFSPNEKTEALAFPPKKILSAKQENKILSQAFFTAFKQTSFNKTFLLQADIVRKYAAGIIAAVK